MRFLLALLLTTTVMAAPKKYKTGLKHDLSVARVNQLFTEPVLIPNTYDLRPQLIPIQDQKDCGSCWAFSTTATVNDAIRLFDLGRMVKPTVPVLSPQYLVDCAADMGGCDGGDFPAFNMIVAPKGSPSLAAYPYRARDGRCKVKPVSGSILKWFYVGDPISGPTTTDIQKAILKYGEVSVTISATDSFMELGSGIYSKCDRDFDINHMINLVGWSNEGAVANAKGQYPVGKGYWIMRNSWGTSWGDKGWGKIRYVDSLGRKCSQIGWAAAFVEVAKAP